MGTTPRSMLLNGWWYWGASNTCGINFKEDDTGELVCGHGMSLFIAAIFYWKPWADRDTAALEQVVDGADDIPPVDIALTLTERRMPRYGGMSTDGWQLHNNILTPEAFFCKTYTIRLEKGTFPVVGKTSSGLCHWYSLCLHFEPSPYPPLEEWFRKRPADIHEYWNRKNFYRQEVEGDRYYNPEVGLSRREEAERFGAKLAGEMAL